MQDCIKFNGIKIAQPDEDGYSAIFATTSTDDSDRDMTLEMHNTPIGTVEGDTHLGVTSSGFVGIVGGSSRQWKHDINSIQAAEIDSHMLYGVRAREFIYNDGYLAVGDCRIGKKIPGAAQRNHATEKRRIKPCWQREKKT